jgi:hypothetical protein
LRDGRRRDAELHRQLALAQAEKGAQAAQTAANFATSSRMSTAKDQTAQQFDRAKSPLQLVATVHVRGFGNRPCDQCHSAVAIVITSNGLAKLAKYRRASVGSAHLVSISARYQT